MDSHLVSGKESSCLITLDALDSGLPPFPPAGAGVPPFPPNAGPPPGNFPPVPPGGNLSGPPPAQATQTSGGPLSAGSGPSIHPDRLRMMGGS